MKKELLEKIQDYRYEGKYLIFEECDSGIWTIENKDYEDLGRLERIRVGAWMSWCQFLNEGCYLSASCQDEVREMTRKLNAKKKKQDVKLGSDEK